MSFGLISAGVGLLTSAAGAYLGGRAGDIARNRLKNAANLPGVNIESLTGQALDNQLNYLDKSTDLASKIGTANQATLMGMEETALPGVGAARTTALDRVMELLGDDQDWLSGVRRRGAALGLTRGVAGSQAGAIGTLRLSDTEKTQRTTQGTSLLNSLIGSLRIANTPGVQAFMGPSASELINIRSQERAQKQAILAKAATIPGQTAAWGNYATQIGGALLGGGLTSMGGAGAAGGASPTATPTGGSPGLGTGGVGGFGY